MFSRYTFSISWFPYFSLETFSSQNHFPPSIYLIRTFVWLVWLSSKSRQWKHALTDILSPDTGFFRVRTLFQKQISRTFPGLFQDSDWFFQDSKIRINPFTPKILMLILLTVCHTFHIFFYLSLTDFQNFPGPVAFFQDFPVLENATIKFQDFPGFLGPVRTLFFPSWLLDPKSDRALNHFKVTEHL